MESIPSYQLVTKPDRTPRIEKLFQYIRSFKPAVCIERAYLLTESYKKNECLSTIVRRAKVIADVLDQMTVFLMPGSLFAGNQASHPRWAPLFPEFDVEWIEEELIQGKPFFPWNRPADCYTFAQEDMEKLRSVIAYWKGRTHTDRLRRRLPREAYVTHNDIKAADIGAYFQGGMVITPRIISCCSAEVFRALLTNVKAEEPNWTGRLRKR